MSTYSLDGVRLAALAAAVPKHTESNQDYARISQAERQFLIKTTGVAERRVARDDQTTADFCEAACRQIFEAGHAQPDDIGLLVFVSQSGDYYLPATAAVLQHKLGLSHHCMAFDVGLGCSGFVYGLSIVTSLMQTVGIKKALLLAGDTSSTTTPPSDKSTHPLFGDAGTATLLERNDQAAPWHFNLMTDGSGAEAIMIQDGGARHKLSPASFDTQPISDGIARSRLNLILDGQAIFAFSVREVPPSVRALLEHANQSIDELDFAVLHQANKLINDTVRKKLKLPAEKVPYSLDDYGNTSSASIPLTMVTRLPKDRDLKLLLSGFGVGFSWGNVLLQTQSTQLLPLIEM